jgi:hypothetical protein
MTPTWATVPGCPYARASVAIERKKASMQTRALSISEKGVKP